MLGEVAIIGDKGFPWVFVSSFEKNKVNDASLCKIKDSNIEH